MRGWAGLIGVFFPFLVLFLASWGPLKGRKLWLVSLLANLVSWVGFVFLVIGFYQKNATDSGFVTSHFVLPQNPWSGPLGFRWDYQSAILSLAASSVIVCFHFLARQTLEASRALMAGLSAYLVCLLGVLGAGDLLLYSIFFAGSIVPRFIVTGIDIRESDINGLRETAFLTILALFSLLVVVLLHSEPFKNTLPEWFQLSAGEYFVRPGAIGFSLLLIATAIGAGIFPFHGNARKIFALDPVERSVPLALQPLFGFTILFRFTLNFFPQEVKEFSHVILGFFSVGISYCAISFLGSKSARDRVFWLQQAVSCLVIIGFFSLSRKGWHGASVLLLFQSLTVPFLLMVMSCHDRRSPLQISRITEFPFFALSSVLAVLFALFLPVSIGFYGVLLVIWSLFAEQQWFLPFVIVAIPVMVLAGVNSMFFHLGEKDGKIQEGEFRDLSREEIWALLPIGIVLLIFGVIPKVLVGPLGTSVSAVLNGLGIHQ